MNLKRLIWKAFSIHKDEFGFALPLFLIYFFSGSFFAVGQIFSETLFLKTYGAKGFSGFFIQNGIAIIIAGIMYNYFMLKLPLQKGYILLISLMSVLIVSVSLVHAQDMQWAPFYIFMANYLFTVFLDIHFFNYAFQHLTIRNSKRILPFIMGGGKLGGIISSILIFYIFSRDISGYGMYVWAVNGILILIPVLIFKLPGLSSAGQSKIRGYDKTSEIKLLDKLMKNIKSSISTPSFIYSVLIAFVVSIINQVSEYYSAKIFNESFSTRNELSAFLSLYTLASDLVTLFFQLFIVSRLINNIGVRKANFVYPASFFSLMAMYIAFPNLAIGILLRFFRKNLSAIIRTPVFNIIMAAGPRDRMPGVKSFVSGIVTPMGMIAGGGAIYLIYTEFSLLGGYVFAVSIGLFYIILAHMQNSRYVKSLKDRIKYDYTPVEDEKGIIVPDYSELFTDDQRIEKNLNIIEALFNSTPSLDLVPVIGSCYDRLSRSTKEAMLNLMRSGKTDSDPHIIRKALKDPDPEFRSMALSLVSGYDREYKEKILEEKYPRMLKAEKYAVSALLSKEDAEDESAVARLLEIKDAVLRNELGSIEFVMLVQAMQYKYFLNHLYELTVRKRDTVMLKCIIPFADKLTRRRIIKIIYIFRNENLDYLVRFIMLSAGAAEQDKAMLLDYREIPEHYMKNLFQYDEKTAQVLLPRLFKNISYRKKSNYLKYFLIHKMSSERELEAFIDFEINRIKGIYELIDYLSRKMNPKLGSYSHKFLNLLLPDIIDLKKHLILKAVSILTGLKIDDVYDSNILLRHKDLDNYILEYIETSLRHTREVISIFEGKAYHLNKSRSKQYLNNKEFAGQFMYLKHFIPEISSLIEYSLGEVFDAGYDGQSNKPMTREEDVMSSLSLMEKIIFLKENKLFSELNINEIIHIARIAREIELSADKIIIQQGERGDSLFIVIEGEVRVFTQQRFLENLGPGSCIGELSIIDEEPRSANVVTTQKTKMLSIKRDDFLLTLKENPAISINIMQVITGRLRKLI